MTIEMVMCVVTIIVIIVVILIIITSKEVRDCGRFSSR